MKKSHKIIIVSAVIIVGILVILGAYSSSMGDKYNVSYKCEFVEETHSIHGQGLDFPSTQGFKFVVYECTIVNLGSEPISPTPSWVRLSHNGSTYGYDIVTYSYVGENQYVSQEISKGASMTFRVIFSIPEDAQGYESVPNIPSYIRVG